MVDSVLRRAYCISILRYTRSYQLKDVVIPPGQLGDLKKFFHQILADEASTAVFKKSGT